MINLIRAVYTARDLLNGQDLRHAATPAQRGPGPAAQRPAHDALPGAFDDRPKPHFAGFTPHKSPCLVRCQNLPCLALRLGRA